MSSETDSKSSSCSSDYERKRKLQKKLKKNKCEKKLKKSKKDKKKKSHKVKKRSRQDSKSSEEEESQFQIAPIAPPRAVEVLSNDDDKFGPALPAHLCKRIQLTETARSPPSTPIVIGPLIPAEFFDKDKFEELTKSSCHVEESEDENIQGSYGPLPVTNEREMTAAQIELEQRALELKMAAIDGINQTQSDQKVREEWMLELPQVGLKGGLAALNNLKRGFHQGKEKPDFSDRTSWTKTPQSENEKQKATTTSKVSQEELEQQARVLYEKQRDDEQEALAKKHKKKHKREESLVEIHQKKLRKEEKKRAKELKASGAKPDRRPFTRDVDLKLNKIDSNQTKQIVDKAKILNTKFSSGHSKYL